MSYYICPACGSSVDAGGHCDCGTNEKPTMQLMCREHHKKLYRKSQKSTTDIYNEFKEIQQKLMHQREIQAAEHAKHRKGIYEQICKKTESQ